MRELEDYVGKTLDDKYRLEQLLGKGGMGGVYLATHLGTERYVALKLIAPQFMRNEEFVERFKREARAAGRLRHPNVVDVTDFGFANVDDGRVAYLVMEYLDGCTLGDVLAEEKTLPLDWTVDILEQVCSAVHEAHQQGIVHRDLKPDNIWLEPNRLGSYRVKVLDFGIAKLADTGAQAAELEATEPSPTLPSIPEDDSEPGTLLMAAPVDLETATLMQPGSNGPKAKQGSEQQARSVDVEEETGTKLFAAQTQHRAAPRATVAHASEDDNGTLLFGQSPSQARQHALTTAEAGAALTRVGAIMGTPLYMSPEQCSGGKIDARTDIYSLGVIAYQMLAGETPFAGPTPVVMRAHREATPQALQARETKAPKRVAEVVMQALSKNPDERPQTAFALASSLRAQADGIGALYRRAFALYSEYFPKFLKLSLLAHIPVAIATLLLIIALVTDKVFLPNPGKVQKIILICFTVFAGLLQAVSYFFAAATISGITAVIVTQLSAAPLRPVKLRSAAGVIKKRWRPFLSTAFRVTLRILIGYILLIIPGIVISIRYALYAPVVLIEGLEKKAAMKRARELASRSWRTIIIVSILQILIPMIVSFMLGKIRVGYGSNVARANLARQIWQQVIGLANVFVIPMMSIVPALLYLKMRQLGGEPLSNVVAQIEEVEMEDTTQWQKRMRSRLSVYTPTSHRTVSRPD
jgi:serine/threonine protein kinase